MKIFSQSFIITSVFSLLSLNPVFAEKPADFITAQGSFYVYNESHASIQITISPVGKSVDCHDRGDDGEDLGHYLMAPVSSQEITNTRAPIACIEMDAPRGVIRKGPYNTTNLGCSISVREDQSIVATAACTQEYMMLTNNTTEELQAEILDAAASKTCDKGDHRGSRRVLFDLQPGETNPFIYDDSLGPMCIIMTEKKGSNYRTSRTEPIDYDAENNIWIMDDTQFGDTNDAWDDFYAVCSKEKLELACIRH